MSESANMEDPTSNEYSAYILAKYFMGFSKHKAKACRGMLAAAAAVAYFSMK